jgi:putative aldouronate transport system substrate-binding protein
MPLLAACGLAAPAPASNATTASTTLPAPGANVATSVPAPAAPPTGGPGGKFALPTYLPIQLVKPDLPPTDAGVDPAYFTFPKTLVASVNGTPSNGGDVSVFTRVILAAPPALDAN